MLNGDLWQRLRIRFSQWTRMSSLRRRKPVGTAADIGRLEELEMRALLTATWDGTVGDIVKLLGPVPASPGTQHNPFGGSVAAIGDLDDDGVADLAVGTELDASADFAWPREAVNILFMNADGTVKSSTTIAQQLNGGPGLKIEDYFGTSLAAVGDLDGDGNTDLAVGAIRTDADARVSRENSGAIYILYLNNDGSVKSSTEITDGVNGGPRLFMNANFGLSVANIGDLNGDGITDLAVGANSQKGHRGLRGAVFILFMKADGSVESSTRIANHKNGGPKLMYEEAFGRAVAGVGDVNGDGVPDLAVGAELGGTPDYRTGAVYVLFMKPNGHVKSSTQISDQLNGGPDLSRDDAFGFAVGAVGDLNGDGITDLAVSSTATNGPLTAIRGDMDILFLDADGHAKSVQPIRINVAGGRPLNDGNFFGLSVTSVGDLNGDGITELAVGAADDNTQDEIPSAQRGALYVLFLNPAD